MKPQVEIIFTFDNLPQQTGGAFLTAEQLDDKKQFFKVITTCLEEDEKETLVKISCCITGLSIPNPNHWYLKCKGKLWDDEIPQLIQEIWNIESKIIPVN